MTVIIVVFALVYLGMALGSAPYVKIDRTGIAMLGAIVLVAGGYIGEQQAWDSISTETMALLLGLMILSAQLKLSGVYQVMTSKIAGLQLPPAALLGVLVGLTALLAAFLTNDVIALAVAPVLIRICQSKALNPMPYLLALCCSVNVGSALTLIGSPQSMLIGQSLKLDFIHFVGATLVPTLVAGVTVWAFIAWRYRNKWDAEAEEAPSATSTIRLNRFSATKGLTILSGVLALFIFSEL